MLRIQLEYSFRFKQAAAHVNEFQHSVKGGEGYQVILAAPEKQTQDGTEEERQTENSSFHVNQQVSHAIVLKKGFTSVVKTFLITSQQNIAKSLAHEGEPLRQAIESAPAANRTSPQQPQQVHQQQSQQQVQQAQQQQLQQQNQQQQSVQQSQAGANLAYLVLPDGRQT